MLRGLSVLQGKPLVENYRELLFFNEGRLMIYVSEITM